METAPNKCCYFHFRNEGTERRRLVTFSRSHRHVCWVLEVSFEKSSPIELSVHFLSFLPAIYLLFLGKHLTENCMVSWFRHFAILSEKVQEDLQICPMEKIALSTLPPPYYKWEVMLMGNSVQYSCQGKCQHNLWLLVSEYNFYLAHLSFEYIYSHSHLQLSVDSICNITFEIIELAPRKLKPRKR